MLENTVKKIDPRKKRTLKVLQAAMVSLLKEQEFSKISVQDITERAEVNRATFYDHFDDKYELLNYLVREEFQERLDANLPDDPLLTMDNLRILTLAMCNYLGAFVGLCSPSNRTYDRSLMLQQVQMTASDLIAQWAERSLPADHRHGISVDRVAHMTSFAIFGAILDWAHRGRKISPQQLTDEVVTLVTAGIGAYLVERV